MSQGDSSSWLIVGALLFATGILVQFSGYSLLRAFGALALLLGVAALLIGIFGFPRAVSSSTRP